MTKPSMPVSFAGGLLLGALLTLAVAAQEPAKPDPTQEMLAALIASQERQAAAWEKLAEMGWPAPQNNTFTGRIPDRLFVALSGDIEVRQPPSFSPLTAPWKVSVIK